MLQHIYSECRVSRFICHTPWTSLTEDTSTESPGSLDWVVKVLIHTYTRRLHLLIAGDALELLD